MKASLSPERWHQVQQLFDEIADLDRQTRAARLDEACREDPALRDEVESLLAAYEQADDLLHDLDQMAAPVSSSRVGRRVAHYEVIEKLGGGGMGVVYKARDTRLKRTVALKFLPPTLSAREEARQRFEHEAQAASSLDHPNICTVHDSGQTDDGHLFIAMAYYQGETLKKKIARGPVPVDEALSYATQMARGLAKAHATGIIHRDVKPANVMVTDDGVVKIVDFGLAKMTDVQLTRTGVTLGTVAYMSPEQARGDVVDAQTDVWSLGVVLYEMLTGKRPFPGEHEQGIIYHILHQEPVPITEAGAALPEEVDHVVRMCLEKEKDLRYPTMDDLLADLEVLTQSTGAYTGDITVSRTSASERIRQRRKAQAWRRVRSTGAGVLAMLVVVFGIVFFRQTPLPVAQHLAVLPFSLAETGLVDQAFTDGLVETVRSTLARLEQTQDSLWVVPAQDMHRYPAASPGDARQLFGVNLAVEGRIEPVGGRIRLALSLVDTRTLETLRFAEIEGQDPHDAMFQAGLLTTVTDLLDLDLAPEVRRTLNTGGTTQSEAYVFYVQGRGYLQRYEDIGSIDTAIQLFNKALEEDSVYALAHAGLGEAYWRKFQLTMDVQWIQEAERYCELAAELNDDLAPVYVTLGLIHTERGRHGSARLMFEDALERDPLHAAAHRGLAALYEKSGEPVAAETTYQRAIALKPDFWGGYNDLGSFYNVHGRYQEALTQFQHVINLTPDNYEGYNGKGIQFYYLRRYDEARAMFERSIEVKPNLRAYRNLAAMYYADQNYAEAARMFEEILARQDTDYEYWGNLANCYHWIGEHAKARRAWTRMIEMAEAQVAINPRDAEALGALAGASAKIGAREEALSYIKSLLALKQRDWTTLRDVARYYEVLGERDLALRYLEEAFEIGLTLVAVERSPWFDALRTDPRYKKIEKNYEAVRE